MLKSIELRGTHMKNYLDKLFIVEGILLIFIGLLFLANPLESLLTLTFIIGLLIILSAISKIVRGWHTENKIYFLFSGIIDILFGLILLLSPISTIEMLLVFYGVWSLIRGLASIILYFKYEILGLNIKTFGAFAAIIIGLIIILCPFVLIFAIPYIPYIIGIYFIVLACMEIYFGVKKITSK